MNNYKNKKIVDIILGAIIITVFAIAFIPTKAIMVYSDKNDTAIYNGRRNSDEVALMFNVYENTENVLKILEILKEKGAVATFFVGGCWADDNKETLQKIIEYGNELGNHGYFHKDHKKLSEEGNFNEINDTDKIVNALVGYKMNLFAPPSGSFSKTTLKVAKNLNYQTIMWSKDTIDWRDSDIKLIIKRATEKVEGGDLILMHPKTHTVDALSEIIDKINKKGLKCVTVSSCCGL